MVDPESKHLFTHRKVEPVTPPSTNVFFGMSHDSKTVGNHCSEVTFLQQVNSQLVSISIKKIARSDDFGMDRVKESARKNHAKPTI